MRPVLAALSMLPLLTACHKHVDKDETTVARTVTIDRGGKATATATVSGGGLKIDTDDFKASLDIPGMKFGGNHLDIDGMRLLPGSEIHGLQVEAHDTDGDKRGKVVMSFTSPGAPDAVLAHAESEARAKGWSVTRTATTLSGTKGERTVAYVVAAAGARTSGTVTILGDDDG